MSVIVLVMIAAVFVPGLALGALAHRLLRARSIDALVRHAVCALAVVVPTMALLYHGHKPYYGEPRLFGMGAFELALAALVLWSPLAFVLESRLQIRRTREGAQEPGEAAVVPPPPAPAPRHGASLGKVAIGLIVVPWLLPIALATAVFGGVFGHFYESNGGVIIIFLGVLVAGALALVGVLLLIVSGLRSMFGRQPPPVPPA